MQLTQLEFTEKDGDFAERIAAKLGYTQTAYTSTSPLVGLFCLPDRHNQRKGCVIKTKKLGFLFVADLEDLNFFELAEEERKACRLAREQESYAPEARPERRMTAPKRLPVSRVIN